MASMRVVVTDCDEQGNVDFADLKAKAEEVADRLCLRDDYFTRLHTAFTSKAFVKFAI